MNIRYIFRTVVFIKAAPKIPEVIVEETEEDLPEPNFKIIRSDRHFRKQSMSSYQL